MTTPDPGKKAGSAGGRSVLQVIARKLEAYYRSWMLNIPHRFGELFNKSEANKESGHK